MSRVLVSSGSPYEPIVGFSRALRVDSMIFVAGTTAASGGEPVVIGDPVAQTRSIFKTIEHALEQVGAGLKDVVRTRVYLVEIAHWDAVGRVHGEIFGDIRPVNTALQVSGFVSPDWLVEIEVDAVVEDASL